MPRQSPDVGHTQEVAQAKDMTKPTTLIRRLIEDPNDPEQLILDLGQELCDELGWNVGDTLTWIDNKDGSWQIKKVDPESVSTS
jgi:hypothetical protein